MACRCQGKEVYNPGGVIYIFVFQSNYYNQFFRRLFALRGIACTDGARTIGTSRVSNRHHPHPSFLASPGIPIQIHHHIVDKKDKVQLEIEFKTIAFESLFLRWYF
jgi:hypothetical protein